MNAPTQSSQCGAALLTVLMIIAAMAVAALAVASAVTQSTQRARALDAQAQLGLYAVSAEEVAKARMTSLLEPIQSRLSADLPGFNEPQIIPVDGGAFTVTVRDASNCFDVNTLANAASTAEEAGALNPSADFQSLLEATFEDAFASDAVALASAVMDWMDVDSVPRSGGAEDSFYASEVPSYRTSSQPFTTMDELRAVRGYTPEVYTAVRPLLCALPPSDQRGTVAININTLSEAQAPLMQLAFGDALSVDDIRALIDSRPIGGWADIESLLEDPIIQRIDPNRIQVDRLGLVTSLVEVSANVSYRGHDMTMRYLFEAVPGQPVRTLRRERIG